MSSKPVFSWKFRDNLGERRREMKFAGVWQLNTQTNKEASAGQPLPFRHWLQMEKPFALLFHREGKRLLIAYIIDITRGKTTTNNTENPVMCTLYYKRGRAEPLVLEVR